MNILDEIKILIVLKKSYNNLAREGKMNKLINFFNGKKTYIGIIGYGICVACPSILPEPLMSYASTFFKGLIAAGVAHKVEKITSVGQNVVKEIKDIKNTVNAPSEK